MRNPGSSSNPVDAVLAPLTGGNSVLANFNVGEVEHGSEGNDLCSSVIKLALAFRVGLLDADAMFQPNA